MKRIAYSDFAKLGGDGLKTCMPVIVTYDGSPVGIFCSLDGVIVVEDLHPRVQNQLRAQESKARAGMPKSE